MSKTKKLLSLVVALCLSSTLMFSACSLFGDDDSSASSSGNSSSVSDNSGSGSAGGSNADGTSEADESSAVDLSTYTGVYNGVCYDNGSLVTGVYSGKYYVDGVPYTGYETVDGTKYRIVDGTMTKFNASVWDGTSVSNSFANTASGSSSDPFKISSAEELMFFADRIENNNISFYNCYFQLTADIDLGGYDITPFAGTGAQFNGNGHVITNFNLVSGGSEYLGLFKITSGTIIDLSVDNFTITNQNCKYVGGLVGYLNSGGKIKKCYVNGTINAKVSSGDKMYVGLLAGYSEMSTSETAVTRCQVSGSVTYDITTSKSSYYVYAGGLVGYVYTAGKIQDCYSTATVSLTVSSSYAYAGGITGYTKGEILNCYCTGDVTSSGSTAYAGGIVGTTDGSVTGCVALGNVTSGNYAGGIIGSSSKGTNCYSYGQTVSGKSSSTTFTATAATEDQMNDSKFWNSTLSWDNTVWSFSALNIGYGLLPILK